MFIKQSGHYGQGLLRDAFNLPSTAGSRRVWSAPIAVEQPQPGNLLFFSLFDTDSKWPGKGQQGALTGPHHEQTIVNRKWQTFLEEGKSVPGNFP